MQLSEIADLPSIEIPNIARSNIARSHLDLVVTILTPSEGQRLGVPAGVLQPALRWDEYGSLAIGLPSAYVVLAVGDLAGAYVGSIVRDLPVD